MYLHAFALSYLTIDAGYSGVPTRKPLRVGQQSHIVSGRVLIFDATLQVIEKVFFTCTNSISFIFQFFNDLKPQKKLRMENLKTAKG